MVLKKNENDDTRNDCRDFVMDRFSIRLFVTILTGFLLGFVVGWLVEFADNLGYYSIAASIALGLLIVSIMKRALKLYNIRDRIKLIVFTVFAGSIIGRVIMSVMPPSLGVKAGLYGLFEMTPLPKAFLILIIIGTVYLVGKNSRSKN